MTKTTLPEPLRNPSRTLFLRNRLHLYLYLYLQSNGKAPSPAPAPVTKHQRVPRTRNSGTDVFEPHVTVTALAGADADAVVGSPAALTRLAPQEDA